MSVSIDLEVICQAINRYSPGVILRRKESSVINAIVLLDKNQRQFESDILYIGKLSDLPPASEITSPVNFLICTDDGSIPEEHETLEQVNWLVVKGCRKPSELLPEIREFFEKHHQNLQNSILLYDASLSGKGIQHIVDVAGEVFGNPVWVADVSFKVLAFTKNRTIPDSFWQKEIETGYLSYETIKNAKREGVISRVYQSNNPVILNFSIDQYRRLSERIVIDGINAGFVSILEYERPFQESDIQLVPLMCKVLSNELKKDNFLKYARGIMYDTLIFDLLDEKTIQEEVLDSRLKYLNLKLGKYLYILTVKFLEESPENLSLRYLRAVLESKINRSMGAIYENKIVLLITRDTKELLSIHEADALNALLRENNMAGGLSLSFHKISNIRDYYLQACMAIELGICLEDGKLLFYYDDYSFYHLLSIAADNVNIKNFCSPLLIELMEYDRQNKTRFTESLYVYLYSGCNAAESARMFYIHRNSMDYRIRRIEELLNIKISDPEIYFTLYLSFKILLLTGEKDFINHDLMRKIMNRPSRIYVDGLTNSSHAA